VRHALHCVTRWLGIAAALLGLRHGFAEMQQGTTEVVGLVIQAYGPACQPERHAHACMPAMSVLPCYRATSILTIAASALLLLWAAWLAHRMRPLVSGLTEIALSVWLLLVGGGYVPMLWGILASVAGFFWGVRGGAERRWVRELAQLWPWVLRIWLAWLVVSTVLGAVAGGLLLRLGLAPFLAFDLGLPPLILGVALAHDRVYNPSAIVV
jgi:hypothetical protein